MKTAGSIGTVLLMVLLLTSCKKEKQPFVNDIRAKTTLELLTKAPWKETTLEYKTADGIWVEQPIGSTVPKPTYVFNIDGTYTEYIGTTTNSGSWVIVGDNTQLAINFSITYDFFVLNSTTMQLALNGEFTHTDPTTGVATIYYGSRQTFIH